MRILYFCKKLLLFLLSIFILSAGVFYISRLAPGDPLVSYYGDRAEKMTALERSAAEERLGLDDPIYVQYIRWAKGALDGDFGISYKYKTDVTEVIGSRIGNTLLLGGLGFFLIFTIAPCIGVLCVWHEGKFPDRLICKAGTAVSCVPEFWMCLVLILFFSVTLRWLPASGAYSVGGGGAADRAVHLILPLTVVVISHLWYYAYMVRNRLMEEVRAEYVLLVKAEGLAKSRIIFRHCLRNMIPSYLSMMAVSVPHIMGGTYIVETVFSYPGIGTLSYESARYQDYNLLMLLCLLSGAAVIFFNMIAGIISEKTDPRLRRGFRPPAEEVRADG